MNRDINAFITIKEIKEETNTGGRLADIKIAVKDNICVKGVRNTCGSRMLENFIPHYSATAVERMLAEGAIIVGKTNMDEFGMGSSTTTSYFGPTGNPVDSNYIAGGSSGGSAAAVAADLCNMALGSDTGGSIRQPAAYCGVVGLKPTFGTVSRYGLVAYASSLEQIGPIAKNVEDCVKLLEVIAGYDEKDSTSISRGDYNFSDALSENVKGMRIGVPAEYFTEDLQPEIRRAVMDAVKVLEAKGAVVEECHLKYVEEAPMVYYVIACAQASSNLARFDGVKYGYRVSEYKDLQDMYEGTREDGFGEEVKRRIKLGEFVLSSGFYEEYYLKALRVNRLIKEQFDQCFDKYDAIISPVTKSGPSKIHEEHDNIKMYMDDLYTVPANLCGFPAISVPFGVDNHGFPIGVQIMSDCFKEKNIIRLAYTLEKSER